MSAGYIDPTITADGPKQARVLEAIRKRGLTLHRVHPGGRTLRLTGPGGLHILVRDLGSIAMSDLSPPNDRELTSLTQRLRA